jgi:hypothetical protein
LEFKKCIEKITAVSEYRNYPGWKEFQKFLGIFGNFL